MPPSNNQLDSIQKVLGLSHHPVGPPRNRFAHKAATPTNHTVNSQKSTFTSKYTLQHLIQNISQYSSKNHANSSSQQQQHLRLEPHSKSYLNKAPGALNWVLDGNDGCRSTTHRRRAHGQVVVVNKHSSSHRENNDHHDKRLTISRIQYYTNASQSHSDDNQHHSSSMNTSALVKSQKRRKNLHTAQPAPTSMNHINALQDRVHQNVEQSRPATRTRRRPQRRRHNKLLITNSLPNNSTSLQSHHVQTPQNHVASIRNLKKHRKDAGLTIEDHERASLEFNTVASDWSTNLPTHNHSSSPHNSSTNTENVNIESESAGSGQSIYFPLTKQKSAIQQSSLIQRPSTNVTEGERKSKFSFLNLSDPVANPKKYLLQTEDPALKRISESLQDKINTMQNHIGTLPNDLQQNRTDQLRQIEESMIRRESFEKHQQQATMDLQKIMDEMQQLDRIQLENEEIEALINVGNKTKRGRTVHRKKPNDKEPVKITQVDFQDTAAKLSNSRKRKKRKESPSKNLTSRQHSRPGTSLGFNRTQDHKNKILLTLFDREKPTTSHFEQFHDADTFDTKILSTSFDSVRVKSALSDHPRFTRKIRNPSGDLTSNGRPVAVVKPMHTRNISTPQLNSSLSEDENSPKPLSTSTWHSSLHKTRELSQSMNGSINSNTDVAEDEASTSFGSSPSRLHNDSKSRPVSRENKRPHTSMSVHRRKSPDKLLRSITPTSHSAGKSAVNAFITFPLNEERAMSALTVRQNPFDMNSGSSSQAKSILHPLPARGMSSVVYYNGTEDRQTNRKADVDDDEIDPQIISSILKEIADPHQVAVSSPLTKKVATKKKKKKSKALKSIDALGLEAWKNTLLESDIVSPLRVPTTGISYQ